MQTTNNMPSPNSLSSVIVTHLFCGWIYIMLFRVSGNGTCVHFNKRLKVTLKSLVHLKPVQWIPFNIITISLGQQMNKDLSWGCTVDVGIRWRTSNLPYQVWSFILQAKCLHTTWFLFENNKMQCGWILQQGPTERSYYHHACITSIIRLGFLDEEISSCQTLYTWYLYNNINMNINSQLKLRPYLVMPMPKVSPSTNSIKFNTSPG